MAEGVMIAMLIIDIVMLLISISCLKDVIISEKQIESTLKSIKHLHRTLELKAQNERKQRTIYPQKESE